MPKDYTDEEYKEAVERAKKHLEDEKQKAKDKPPTK